MLDKPTGDGFFKVHFQFLLQMVIYIYVCVYVYTPTNQVFNLHAGYQHWRLLITHVISTQDS